MPQIANIDAAIRNIVAEQVASAMDPYRVIFERLSAFAGEGGVRRGPGRPRKAGAPVRRAARAGAKDAARAAKAFQMGDTVVYRQGRGAFEAKVLKIDEATGLMTVERLSDGKKVERPASKVSARVGGGEQAKASQAKARKPRKARKAAKRRAAKAAKVDFAEGQKVVYRQGRGMFEAKIVALDLEAGTVKLEREKDGKKVTRPVSKISAAA